MYYFLHNLFNASDFMPHGHCYFWRPEILWLHVLSDSGIALSYFAISASLLYILRKRKDLPFRWLFALFGLFIAACGTTHLLNVVTVWAPIYRFDGVLKAMTALISMGTAWALVPIIPRVLAMTSLEMEALARLETEAKLRAQHDVALIAAENVSLADAAPHFMRVICQHLGCQLGELWNVDPGAGVMRLSQSWVQPGGSAEETALISEFAASTHGRTFAKGEGMPGRVWQCEAPVWEHELINGGSFQGAEAAQKAGLATAFAFPLRGGPQGEITSVMVFLSRCPGPHDDTLVATMNTLARQIGQFTERCRAEASLRTSQARFSAFLENAPAMVYMKDGGGRFLYGNQSLFRQFGLSPEKFLGKTDFDLWPEVAPALREVDARVLAGEEPVEAVEQVPLQGGNMGHWISYKFPLYDEWTGNKFLAGISFDITPREHAEAALREERKFLDALLDNLQAGVIACDAQGRLTHCNQAAAALHGLGAEDSAPTLQRWAQFFRLPPEPGIVEAGLLAPALRGEVWRDREFLVRTASGDSRALSLNAAAFADNDGRQLGAVGVIHDVTARRQAREDALLALREKETLLREVHHRVKNNLQIVDSLLSMQARRARLPEAVEALHDSANRVRSIALVHEKLYEPRNPEFIPAADYLRTLSRNLMEALGAEQQNLPARIKLDLNLEEGHLFDASLATSCGLIVNEALTNCFKHGFPGQRNGRVTICLTGSVETPEAEPWLCLAICDNGIGLPASALTASGVRQLGSGSLGLRLIDDLTKQIHGRLQLLPTDAATGEGLTLRVAFPAPGRIAGEEPA
jgi:PAS domain S-box-containing protein